MENLKKLESDSAVRYCSGLCRREKLDKKDQDLEEAILLAVQKVAPSNICPSQVTRQFFNKDSWKQYHQRVVKACRRLHLDQKIRITQKKKTVGSLNFKGPIRIETRLK